MSINQNPQRAGRAAHRPPLPDFRNLGVVLRVVVLVNALAMAAVLVRNGEFSRLGGEVLDMALRVEFPLILCVAALFLAAPLLRRLAPVAGYGVTLLLVLGVTALVHGLMAPLGGDTRWPVLWTLVVAVCVLVYFHQRSTAQAPALAEARLLALTARIRPHFLFNSLNGVLGVLRANPRRAEEALEELADLFRALMQDNRELVPLSEEITLCERYLSLERLRLGERLQVQWLRDAEAEATLVPPLLLQPLVENAVYHGIEPGAEPGTVSITIARRGPEVHIRISNPLQDPARHHAGNRMALDNIRERLMLFFDLEASLDTWQDAGVYHVRIRLPFRSRP